MSMTERLRSLLDERGVKWADIDTGGRRSLITLWHGTDGMEWQFYENTKTNWTLLKSRRDHLTPEQAIAATLGAWTCHDEGTFHSWGYLTCSNCKVVVPVEAVREAPSIGKVVPISFCPNCGSKVVG